MANANSLSMGTDSSSSGFSQQCQLDWVTFGNTTVSASLNVLRRLSAAGVQTVTHCGGLYLGTSFVIGEMGERRMDEAIGNLRTVSGFDNVLYFGFGYMSYVRILAETRAGINCVALCSCLSDSHSEIVTARILAALWRELKFPQEYEPAHSQFISLARACAGVVAATTFGQTVNIMKGDVAKFNEGSFNSGISEPADVAKALHGLFDISKGITEGMTVVGGAEGAFIAALAVWLFNLTTTVEDDQGNLIFTSTANPEFAQVKVRYRLRHETSAIQTRQTYVLGEVSELLTTVPDYRMRNVTSRIPWDRCLVRSFGSKFRKLQGVTNVLGSFLGSAARIYAALANGEYVGDEISKELFINFADASYGHGFIDSVGRIFPELGSDKGLWGVMLRAVEVTVDSALCRAEEAIESLKNICDCEVCEPRREGIADGFCLPSIVMTISYLVAVLASVVQSSDLDPCAEGFEPIYRQKQLLWAKVLQSSEQKSSLLYDILGIVRNGENRLDRLAATPAGLIADVVCIFTGHKPMKTEIERRNYETAVSSSGICIYLDALESLTSNPALLRRVHVIPGHISWNDRIYGSVWDCAPGALSSVLDPITFDEDIVDIVRELKFCDSPEAMQIRALVSEVISDDREAIAYYYKVTLARGTVLIRPGFVTEFILKHTGLLACKRNEGGCKDELAFKCTAVTKGWELPDTLSKFKYPFDIACCIWTYYDDIARCLIIERQNTLTRARSGEGNIQRQMFIRRNECISCCTHSILAIAEAGLQNANHEKVFVQLV